MVPFCKDKRVWINQHLYVCPAQSTELKRHIIFRNYLRNNKNMLDEYGLLKKKLAEKYASEREKYTEAKTDFIISVLKKANL